MLIDTAFIIFMLSSFFICMLIFTCVHILKKSVYLTLQFPLLSSISRTSQWPCCWTRLPGRKSLTTTYFWWMADRKSVPCFSISSAQESELPALTKQGLGRLCTQFHPVYRHDPGTEWKNQAGDGRLAPCSEAGLGNPGWLLSSAGQEDGVKTRFPSHTITTVWFSHCVWIDLGRNFQKQRFSVIRVSFSRSLG